MPVALHHVVIDTHDLQTLPAFWAAALGWRVLSVREREVVVGPSVERPRRAVLHAGAGRQDRQEPAPPRPDHDGGEDRDAEIDRLLALGARRVDVGQTGEESWTVLADPEGNEFCVVRPKDTLVG